MFGGDGGGLGESFLQKQIGEEGAGGDGSDTALRLEASGHNMSILNAHREPQNVTANGIGNFGRGRRRIEFPGIVRVFEMAEE